LNPLFDEWIFGLEKCSFTLPENVSCSLLDLYPVEMIDNTNRPFWITFKHPLKFKEHVQQRMQTIHVNDDTTEVKMIKVTYPSRIELTRGALTEMHRFHLHPDYICRIRSSSTFIFRDRSLIIQSNKAYKSFSTDSSTITTVKHKFTTDSIDRTVVFHLHDNGFDLFIHMKGNLHEYHRCYLPQASKSLGNQSVGDNRDYIRFGVSGKDLMPLFSTVRLRIVLENSKTTTDDDETSAEMRTSAVQTIRELFQMLLAFFRENRILVCFGLVYTCKTSINRLDELKCVEYQTMIQEYSWAMLLSIGFRFHVQLYRSKSAIEVLHQYSKKTNDASATMNVDDLFYRLCLYLHRRSSEYIFLNLDEEIQIGIESVQVKMKQSKRIGNDIPYFLQSNSRTAYVPSATITPTTICVRPLKLSRLNRIIREKRFGGCLNFALIELRDESQESLTATEYRALRQQIYSYLTHGFKLTKSRIYKYLHHSQSQVKCKQFWFYYHDKNAGCLSHQDAYAWMGNFDKERIVAKHTARIALCFTSTEATIRVEHVNKITWC
jgi:hypothetical protein